MNSYDRNSPQHSLDNQGVTNILCPKITSTPLSPSGKSRILGPLITPRKFIGPRRYALSNNGNMSLKTAIRDPPGPLLTSTNYNVNVSTYIDTKSPGYTGRLVQYNEESPRNKQLTHQEKYGSPGLFPIVHLFKKDPPVISPKPNKVTVHVGTPDLRSQFSQEHNRLILEGIVKKNSLKNNNQIHDTSTRSVLDALKEISRKRLHANEEYEFIDENNKKLRREYSNEDGDTSKRNRLDSPTSDSSISPPSRPQTKRLCTIDAVLASKTSSMYANNYDTGVKRKTSEDVKGRTPPINKKFFSNVETQTSDIATSKQEVEKNEEHNQNDKKIEENPLAEAQSSEENVEVVQHKQVLKIFDDKPLEIIRKNRLGALLSALTGQEIPPIPMEDRRKALDQDWPPQKSDKLVSILSPSNKPQKSTEKHVKFNLPDSTDSNSGLSHKPANVEISDLFSKNVQSTHDILSKSGDKAKDNLNENLGIDKNTPNLPNLNMNSAPARIENNKEHLGGFKFDLGTSNNFTNKDQENESSKLSFGKSISTSNSNVFTKPVKSTEHDGYDSFSTLKSNDTVNFSKTNSLGLPTSLPQTKISTSNESLKLDNLLSAKNDIPLKGSVFQVRSNISTAIANTTAEFNSGSLNEKPSEIVNSNTARESLNAIGSPFNSIPIKSIEPINSVTNTNFKVKSVNSSQNIAADSGNTVHPLFGSSTAPSKLPSSFTVNTLGNNKMSSTDTGISCGNSLAISSMNNSISKNSSPTSSTVTTFSPNFGITTSTSRSLNNNSIESKTSLSSITPEFKSTSANTNMFRIPSNTSISSSPNLFDSTKVTNATVTASNQMFTNTITTIAKTNSFGADSKLFTFGKNDNITTSSVNVNSSSMFMVNAGTAIGPASSNKFGAVSTFPVGNNLEQNKVSSFTKNVFGSNGSSPFVSTGSTNLPSFGTTNSLNTQTVKAVSSSFGTPCSLPSTTFSATNSQTFVATNSNTPSFVPTTIPSFGCPTTTASFGANTFGTSTTSPLFGTLNTPAFGITTTSSFGTKTTPSFSSANTFGSATFGINPTPFGVGTTTSSTTLGANSASTSFGSSSNLNNSFGSFGSANPPFAPASTTSSFVTTTQAFGNTANSTFGASNAMNSPFGGTAGVGSFVTNNNTASTNTFGSSFGATSTKSEPSGFPSQGNMFNSSSFGMTQNSNSTANVSKSGVFAFGSSNVPTTASSGIFTFGATEPSKSFNFNSSSTTGNALGSSGNTFSASTFGQTNNSSTSFGQNNTITPSFGQNNTPTHSFGQNNTPVSPFGQNNTHTPSFGQSNNPTPLFGQNNPTTVPFGQSNTPAPSFGLSNSPAPTFAQSNTLAPSFGQNNTPTPSFGQNNIPSPSFGQNTTVAASFGQSSTPNMFSIGSGPPTSQNRSRPLVRAKRRT